MDGIGYNIDEAVCLLEFGGCGKKKESWRACFRIRAEDLGTRDVGVGIIKRSISSISKVGRYLTAQRSAIA
jgi:hypothetical protein